MQAAADMPRPVGARCRDAAVCLALALLVASWLCAPAHGLGHVPRPGSLCPGCSGLSSQRPSTPALCCRRRGGPRRGGQRQGSPHPCSRRPGSRGLSCPGPRRTCAACSSTRALTTSVRGPPPWRACERAARLCLCSPCSPALPHAGAAWSGRPPMLGMGAAQRVSYRTRPAGYGPRPSSTGSWSTRCTSAARRVTRTPTGRCAAFCCCGTRAVRMGAR